MSQPYKIDYLRGFRVITQDPQWTGKFLTATVLLLSSMCIPLVGQLAVAGWTGLIIRRVVAGDDSLPRLDFDFDYLGKLLGVGFKGFLATMLWIFPAMMLFGVIMMCMQFGLAALMAGGGAAMHASGGGEAAGAGLGIIAILVAVFIYLFMLVFIILAQQPAKVAKMRAELTDDLNAGMQFKEVMAFTKAMLKPMIIGSIVIGLVSMPLFLVGMLACGLGAIPAGIAVMIAQTHLMAQIYQAWLARGGEALAVAGGDLEVPSGGYPPNTGTPQAF